MNMKITSVVIIFMTFLAINALPARAQDKSILQLADEYSLALRKYQAQKSRMSVESVLRKGRAVAEKINEMEALSDADYSLLERKMKGFTVNREEILFVEPDSKFFMRLSETRGTKADAAFFTLLRQIKPRNVWAAYIEPQTDVTGCTIYGNGVLTGLYGKALQFKKTYPRAYVKDIDTEINEILSELIDNTCACGDRDSVFRELGLFLRTFPTDKNAPAIRRKLASVKRNQNFRFNCQSG